MSRGTERRARLARAHLYLVADAGMSDAAVRGALAGGVDMLQLRDPGLTDDELLAVAHRWRAACADHHALFWFNDRPDLALAAGADGVHVGQDDAPVSEVRAQVGPDVLIGLSTHHPDQLSAAAHEPVDQLSVGPVWETPTKPGRAATGLEYVRAAVEAAPSVPWFAIGGIDHARLDEVLAAGATRVVVVRAITEADDPEAAARSLRERL